MLRLRGHTPQVGCGCLCVAEVASADRCAETCTHYAAPSGLEHGFARFSQGCTLGYLMAPPWGLCLLVGQP